MLKEYREGSNFKMATVYKKYDLKLEPTLFATISQEALVNLKAEAGRLLLNDNSLRMLLYKFLSYFKTQDEQMVKFAKCIMEMQEKIIETTGLCNTTKQDVTGVIQQFNQLTQGRRPVKPAQGGHASGGQASGGGGGDDGSSPTVSGPSGPGPGPGGQRKSFRNNTTLKMNSNIFGKSDEEEVSVKEFQNLVEKVQRMDLKLHSSIAEVSHSLEVSMIKVSATQDELVRGLETASESLEKGYVHTKLEELSEASERVTNDVEALGQSVREDHRNKATRAEVLELRDNLDLQKTEVKKMSTALVKVQAESALALDVKNELTETTRKVKILTGRSEQEISDIRDLINFHISEINRELLRKGDRIEFETKIFQIEENLDALRKELLRTTVTMLDPNETRREFLRIEKKLNRIEATSREIKAIQAYEADLKNNGVKCHSLTRPLKTCTSLTGQLNSQENLKNFADVEDSSEDQPVKPPPNQDLFSALTPLSNVHKVSLTPREVLSETETADKNDTATTFNPVDKLQRNESNSSLNMASFANENELNPEESKTIELLHQPPVKNRPELQSVPETNPGANHKPQKESDAADYFTKSRTREDFIHDSSLKKILTEPKMKEKFKTKN